MSPPARKREAGEPAPEIESLLSLYESEIRELALRLREMILSVAPGAREEVYSGWKTVWYSFDGSRRTLFCSIAPHARHVSLQFARGSELEDPESLLRRDRRSMRQIRVYGRDEADAPALRELVERAAALARG